VFRRETSEPVRCAPSSRAGLCTGDEVRYLNLTNDTGSVMAKATVREVIEVPASQLWHLVADFGNVGWIPGGESARTEGRGAGMVRIFGAGDAEIRERLEEVDDANRRIVYTIPHGLPMPIKNYRSTMTVHHVDDARCGLEWSCTFDPDGVPESDARAQVENLYTMMVGWIRHYLHR